FRGAEAPALDRRGSAARRGGKEALRLQRGGDEQVRTHRGEHVGDLLRLLLADAPRARELQRASLRPRLSGAHPELPPARLRRNRRPRLREVARPQRGSRIALRSGGMRAARPSIGWNVGTRARLWPRGGQLVRKLIDVEREWTGPADLDTV